MLLCLRILMRANKYSTSMLQKQTFLTNDYKCSDAWNLQRSAPVLSKVNLNDFYNILDQGYASKGVISATDVDIFANAIKDSSYLDELRDILHKLRLSAETGNTLQSTHHATIRNYIEFGNTQDLIDILKEPLTYGVFLDDYTANILLDKLIRSEKFEEAATVAALFMTQEDFSNSITCALSQYASYKYVMGYNPPAPEPKEERKIKVEEVKIRIKFLRNPYFDDHFDIKETILQAGKTLAWISENNTDNLSTNLQLIGWLFYKKYDKLLTLVENVSKSETFEVYKEVTDLVQRELGNETMELENKATLQKCLELLAQAKSLNSSMEEALKVSIENAINKSQKQDVAQQNQLFQLWAEIREEKLNEQIKRLDRAKRIQLVQEKQEKLKETEQKLWFFEEEEQIDLKIEEKEKRKGYTIETKSLEKDADIEYIPPEILPKRK